MAVFGWVTAASASQVTPSSQRTAVGLPWVDQLVPAIGPWIVATGDASPRLVQATTALARAEGRRTELRAARLPSLGGFSQFNFQNETRTDASGSTTKIYYNLALTQALYHWGAIEAQARLGDIERAVARSDFAEVQRLLGLEVRGQFLSLIVSRLAVQRAEVAAARAAADLALVQERVQRGAEARTAEAGAQMAADDAALLRDRARADLAGALAAFGRLIGAPPPTLEALPTELPPVPRDLPPLDAWVAAFLGDDGPDVAALRSVDHRLASEEQNLRVARARLKPKVNFAAGLSQDEVNYTSDVSDRTKLATEYVGISINWQIFDGFASRGQVRQVLARRRALQLERGTTLADLEARVRRMAEEIGFTARALDLAERRFAGAVGNVEFVRGEHKRGLVSAVDLERAEINFTGDRAAIMRARADYLMRCAEFISLLGLEPSPSAPVLPESSSLP